MRRRLGRRLPPSAHLALALLAASLGISLGACTGRLLRTGGDGSTDAGGVIVHLDLGGQADLGTTPVDLGPAARDLGPPPPVDLGPMPGCAGGPLAAPIAGCAPTPVPDTGDPHADCVTRINQFRWQCQCLPPLMRWTAGEACADMDAEYDQMHMTPHAGFGAGICGSGYGQNECPGWLGWGSVSDTISGCLQQMWDEGPGDFYGPPAHGHYLNMSSTSFSSVACGFYSSGGGTTAAQNFQ